MKNIIREYSYSIVKMFINQFAIGIFGAMLAMAVDPAGSGVLSIVVSVFAVLFYLFLIYTMTWEIGAKDRISVDIGKKPYRPHLGLVLSLIANIPNFIIAIVYSVAYPFMGTHKWAGTINSIVKVISLIIEGMYTGITSSITVWINGTPRLLHHFWWTYFLITIPALVTSWIAYYTGHKNMRFGALFAGPKPEREKPKK